MFRVVIISFGKLKLPGSRSLCDYYLRNCARFIKVDEIELPLGPQKMGQEAESKHLLQLLGKLKVSSSQAIFLDEKAPSQSTKKWLESWNRKCRQGNGLIVYAIGGPFGWHGCIKDDQSLEKVSFGLQTHSHELSRVILCEQLYRVGSLSQAHPFHNP